MKRETQRMDGTADPVGMEILPTRAGYPGARERIHGGRRPGRVLPARRPVFRLADATADEAGPRQLKAPRLDYGADWGSGLALGSRHGGSSREQAARKRVARQLHRTCTRASLLSSSCSPLVHLLFSSCLALVLPCHLPGPFGRRILAAPAQPQVLTALTGTLFKPDWFIPTRFLLAAF